MATYKAPLRDQKFAYFELHDGASLTKLPGYEEATPDLLLSVAEELGKIATEVLQPMNASGDREGCRLENGVVTTPQGFAAGWKLLADGGWMGLTSRAEHGGQNLPHTVGNMTAEILQGANLSFSMYYALTGGAYTALDKHATDAVKAYYLPKILSITGKRKTPALALIVPGIIGFIMAVLNQGDLLILVAVFGATISYVMMTLSHIILRIKEPDLERPYRTPGGVVTTGIAFVLAIVALIAGFLVDTRVLVITAIVYAIALLYFGLYSRHHIVATAPEEEFELIESAESELH